MCPRVSHGVNTKRRNDSPCRAHLAVILLLLSATVYGLHYVIFRDTHHIFIYLMGDIGFLFVEVLLVTLIIHQILSEREKRTMLRKLNMVIDAFFSEVGIPLLKRFRDFDTGAEGISQQLVMGTDSSPAQFEQMRHALGGHSHKIDSHTGNLAELRTFVVEQRPFLVRLLENPNLLKHEAFTELLWAVFHLADGLPHRPQVTDLPELDYGHLAGDIQRAYALLVRQWLAHTEHLKVDHPYLFWLAVRMNPFDANATIQVTG